MDDTGTVFKEGMKVTFKWVIGFLLLLYVVTEILGPGILVLGFFFMALWVAATLIYLIVTGK